MRPRTIVMTILAGVTAVAGPAAAMELAAPPRPHVAPAAEAPATVPATTAPRRAEPPAPPKPPVTAAPEAPKPAPTAPPAPAPAPEPVKAVVPMRFACTAGRPGGAPAVRCEWDAAAGAARYALYRKRGDGTEPQRIWSGTDLNHVDTAVADGGTYGYGVKALDGAGHVVGAGGPVGVRCCGEVATTLPAQPQPIALACTAGRPDGVPAVRCDWGAAAGAARYELYRKSGDGTEPQRIWSGTDLNHVDKTVADGGTYGYGVKALDGAGHVVGAGGPVGVRCCGEVATTVPAQPQTMALACAAGRPDGVPAVRCEWGAAAGAARYELYRKSGDGTEPQRIWSGTDLNHVDTAVVDGAAYGYGVKALDGAGHVVGAGGPVLVPCCAAG